MQSLGCLVAPADVRIQLLPRSEGFLYRLHKHLAKSPPPQIRSGLQCGKEPAIQVMLHPQGTAVAPELLPDGTEGALFPEKIPTEIAQEILLHQSYGLQSLQTGMEYLRILPIGFGVNLHQFRLPDLRVLSKKNQHKNHLKPLSCLAKHLVMQEIHDHSPFFCISVLHTWSFIHSIHRKVCAQCG